MTGRYKFSEIALSILLGACIWLSCRSVPPLQGLSALDRETPDSDLVHRGRPSGFLQVVPEEEIDRRILQAIEGKVEERESVLRRWAESFTGLQVSDFRFTFAVRERSSPELHVRYFAQTLRMDPIYAGVQLYFTVDPGDMRVKEVLFDPVPYE
jgi:hypothetical protein